MIEYKPLFIEPGHTGTILHIVCLKEYGAEYMDWELETLELNILDDLKVTEDELDVNLFDRIHALNIALSTDLFHTYFESFEAVIKALNYEDPTFGTLTPCSPEQIAVGIFEVNANDSEHRPFSYEVKGYIRACLQTHGFYKAPKMLENCNYNKHHDTSWVLNSDEHGAYAKERSQGQQTRVQIYLDSHKKSLEDDLNRFGLVLNKNIELKDSFSYVESQQS